MNPQRGYDLAEEQLQRDLEDGRISRAEFNDEIRSMARSYREDMEDAAAEAAQRERERW